MTSRNRGADALVAALSAAKVRRIFTLSGNHVMPVFDAAIDAGIELIHVRHEAAAVHMADAWARLTGEAGAALVTGGPGHANAVGALYTAAMAESPVVLLSGHSPRGETGKGAFQEMRQQNIAAPLTKASWTCSSPGYVASDVEKAVLIAKDGRPGPVHLSLPTDVLEGHARVGGSSTASSNEKRQSARAPRAKLDPAIYLSFVKEATRPLILVGPASCTKRGRERMATLEVATGVPVICMESPRGIADPGLGAFSEILAQADAILLLGKRLDFTLRFGKPPAIAETCKFMQIDAQQDEISRTKRALPARVKHATVAPLFEATQALTTVALKGKPQESSWRGEVRAALEFRPAAWDTAASTLPGRLHPVQALRPLQALLDAHSDAVFVSDGGEFGQWAQACLRAPNRVINGVAGAIGPALPFAVAARIAKPHVPIIVAMGDGTFGFHPAEIDTAVRYKLPFVAVVGNDARWNAEHQIQLREYGPERAIGTDLLATRYDEVARGFGGHGEFITDPVQILKAAKRGMDSGLPAILNVMIEGVAAPNVKR
ncbi:MAG TPA: thiamine pyrophosphate-binding protein [Usitatibacter sp.]|nr:thiamine pyrophosphate-binding protein [Usitatibacter sp.]